MTCDRCKDGPLDVEAVAKLMGIKPNSVARSRLRQTFPPEDGTVSGRPYWWPETLAAWKKEKLPPRTATGAHAPRSTAT